MDEKGKLSDELNKELGAFAKKYPISKDMENELSALASKHSLKKKETPEPGYDGQPNPYQQPTAFESPLPAGTLSLRTRSVNTDPSFSAAPSSPQVVTPQPAAAAPAVAKDQQSPGDQEGELAQPSEWAGGQKHPFYHLDNPPTPRWQMYEASKRGDFETSDKIAADLIEKNSADPYAFRMLYYNSKKQGAPNLELLKKAIELNPNDPALLADVAFAAKNTGDFKMASAAAAKLFDLSSQGVAQNATDIPSLEFKDYATGILSDVAVMSGDQATAKRLTAEREKIARQIQDKTPTRQDWILSQAINNSMIGNALKAGLPEGSTNPEFDIFRNFTPSTSDELYASLGSLILDMGAFVPGGMVGGAIAGRAVNAYTSFAIKQAAKKMLQRGMSKEAINRGISQLTKKIIQSPVTGFATAAASSAGSLGYYDAGADLLSQLANGATIEDADYGQTLGRFVHGHLLGAIVGPIGYGTNMARKAVTRQLDRKLAMDAGPLTTDLVKGVGSVATGAAGFAAENVAFVTGGALLEGRPLSDITTKDWVMSFGTLGGLKAIHMAKAFIKSENFSADKVNKDEFNVKFTPEERRAIERLGYDADVPSAINNAESIMADGSVPQTAKMKIMWAGHGVRPAEYPSIYGVTVTEGADGKWNVRTTNKEGHVVSEADYPTKQQASDAAIEAYQVIKDVKTNESIKELTPEQKAEVLEMLQLGGVSTEKIAEAMDKHPAERTAEDIMAINSVKSTVESVAPIEKAEIKPPAETKAEVPAEQPAPALKETKAEVPAPKQPAPNPMREVVQPIDFSKQLEEKYGVTVDLLGNLEKDKTITLSKIVVPTNNQGKGVGTDVMNEIIAYADKHGKTIVLTPSTDFGGSSVTRLEKFYKQFGFVKNSGNNKDFTIKESMHRKPAPVRAETEVSTTKPITNEKETQGQGRQEVLAQPPQSNAPVENVAGAKPTTERSKRGRKQTPVTQTAANETPATIIGKDTDLKGKPLAERMIPIERDNTPRVDDTVIIKGKNGNPDYEGNYRGKTSDGLAIIVPKKGLQHAVPIEDITLKGEGRVSKGDVDRIQYAAEEGVFANDIKEGRMTADDAVKIIESAGLEVPKEIRDMAETTPAPVTPAEKSAKISPDQAPQYVTRSGISVFIKDGELVMFDSSGKEVPKITKTTINKDGKKVNTYNKAFTEAKREYLESIQYDNGEVVEFFSGITEDRADEFTLATTKNPKDAIDVYESQMSLQQASKEGTKDWHIANILTSVVGTTKDPVTGKYTPGSFANVDDYANVTGRMARAYFRKNGQTLDQVAQSASMSFRNSAEEVDVITPQDVADFIKKYPNGTQEYFNEKPRLAVEAEAVFERLTGLKLTKQIIDIAKKQQSERADAEKQKRRESRPVRGSEEVGPLEQEILDEISKLEKEVDVLEAERKRERLLVEKRNSKVELNLDIAKSNELFAADQNFVSGRLEEIDATLKKKKERIETLRSKKDQARDADEMQRDLFENNEVVEEVIPFSGRGSKHMIPVSPLPSSGPPKKVPKIIKDFYDGLKRRLDYTKSGRKSAGGWYSPSSGAVTSKEANNLVTAAHEGGHAIRDIYKILNGAKDGHLDAELKTYWNAPFASKPPKGLSPDGKMNYKREEGFAEWFRTFVSNPDVAKQSAQLYHAYLDNVPKKVQDVVQRFSDDVRRFAGLKNSDKINATVEDISTKDRVLQTIKDLATNSNNTWRNLWMQAGAKLSNNKLFAEDAWRRMHQIKGIEPMLGEKNFLNHFKLLRDVSNKAMSMAENGLRTADNKPVLDAVTNENVTLRWAMEPIEGRTYREIQDGLHYANSVGIAKRTVEYNRRFVKEIVEKDLAANGKIPPQSILSEYPDLVAKYQDRINNNTNGEHKESRYDLSERTMTGIGAGTFSDLTLAKETLKEFEDLKTTDPQKHDAVNESIRRYEVYADALMKYWVDSGRMSAESYQRIKDNNEFYYALKRIKELSPEDAINIQTGTGAGIGSRDNTIKTVKGGAGSIQRPYVSLAEMTDRMITEADKNRVMSTFIDPLRVTRSMGSGESKYLAEIGFKVDAEHKGEPIITVFNKGEKEHWRLAPEIYEAFQAAGGVPHVLYILTTPQRIMRGSITHFPTFQIMNRARDITTRMQITQGELSYKDFKGRKQAIDNLKVLGASQFGKTPVDKVDYYRMQEKAMKEMAKDRKTVMALHPNVMAKYIKHMYDATLGSTEIQTRAEEYNAVYRKMKKQGLSDYDAQLEAARAAREILDFKEIGEWMKFINAFVPFTNARLKGIQAYGKSIKRDPAGTMMRFAMIAIMPQIANSLVIALSSDDTKKRYKQLPDWRRDMFYNIPLPGSDWWITWPKPFESGLAASMIGRGMDYFAIDDTKAFDNKYLFWWAYNMSPISPSIITNQSGQWVTQILSNYDQFRDAPIVPYYEGKVVELREGTKNASRIGQLLQKVSGDNMDARYIDFAIKSQFGYFGDIAMRASNIGSDAKTFKMDWSATRLLRQTSPSQAKDIDWLFDFATKYGYFNEPGIKRMTKNLKMYRDLPKEQKPEFELRILNDAEKLRQRFEQTLDRDYDAFINRLKKK